jgi:hypothetical protein
LQAWNVITENFDAVSENPEFLDMAVDSLLEVIKYDDIQVGDTSLAQICLSAASIYNVQMSV